MNDDERQEWSRHYDTLSWAIMGLFAAAIGYFADQSIEQRATPSLYTNTAGLVLSLSGIYYFAAFKRYRNTIHHSLRDRELRDSLTKSAPHPLATWDVMVLLVAATSVIFITQLLVRLRVDVGGAVLGSAPVWAAFIWLWDFGRDRNHVNAEPVSAQSTEMRSEERPDLTPILLPPAGLVIVLPDGTLVRGNNSDDVVATAKALRPEIG